MSRFFKDFLKVVTERSKTNAQKYGNNPVFHERIRSSGETEVGFTDVAKNEKKYRNKTVKNDTTKLTTETYSFLFVLQSRNPFGRLEMFLRFQGHR